MYSYKAVNPVREKICRFHKSSLTSCSAAFKICEELKCSIFFDPNTHIYRLFFQDPIHPAAGCPTFGKLKIAKFSPHNHIYSNEVMAGIN